MTESPSGSANRSFRVGSSGVRYTRERVDPPNGKSGNVCGRTALVCRSLATVPNAVLPRWIRLLAAQHRRCGQLQPLVGSRGQVVGIGTTNDGSANKRTRSNQRGQKSASSPHAQAQQSQSQSQAEFEPCSLPESTSSNKSSHSSRNCFDHPQNGAENKRRFHEYVEVCAVG